MSASDGWRIEETKKALAEADPGDFVTEREVELKLEKWKSEAD